MKTVSENLKTQNLLLQRLFTDLISRSSTRRWHDPSRDPFVYLGGHFSWNALDIEGRQIQAALLKEYRRFHAILSTLLQDQSEKTLYVLKRSNERLLDLIQQNQALFTADTSALLQSGLEALNEQSQLIDQMHAKSEDNPLFVPDTNALIYNPALDQWRFDISPRFVIAFTPSVLSELDLHKVNHRVDAVRVKAEKLVRQIKEYRRRAQQSGGKLTEGATLIRDISSVIAIPTEPKMEKSLPWLDSENKDDRLLASVVEIMRSYPRSPVMLVTGDVNLQNKAEFAGVPFCEPPEP